VISLLLMPLFIPEGHKTVVVVVVVAVVVDGLLLSLLLCQCELGWHYELACNQ